jgi:hypothetical protein
MISVDPSEGIASHKSLCLALFINHQIQDRVVWTHVYCLSGRLFASWCAQKSLHFPVNY